MKKRNLYIKEKAKMFSSMAFDQDFMQTIFRRLLRISYPLMVEST